MKRKCLSLWGVFFLYMFCCITMEVKFGILLSVWGIGLSVYLLVKNKLPSNKSILISILLTLLVFLSYFGFDMGVGVVIKNGLISGIPTLICSLAVCSVVEKNQEIKLISKKKKYSAFLSIIIAIVVGSILSVINYFLMKGSNSPDFEISIFRLIVCFNPAIYEEIVCRAIFMAFCMHTAKEEKLTKFQNFTMWFMMCVPHAMLHGGFAETVVLGVCFGLPFTILQRKRDITSSMVSHGIVDAVRFTLFGLGM